MARRQELPKSLRKPPEIFYLGLDFTKFNFKKGYRGGAFKYLMAGLSTNSNQKFNQFFMGHLFDLTFLGAKNYKLVMLYYKGVAVMEIKQIEDDGLLKMISWTVKFYSSYFYVEELKGLYEEFINTYESKISVSRVDVCVDVAVPVDVVFSRSVSKFRKRMEYSYAGKRQTFYLGSKSGNGKHFVRVYDKKLDSQKKGKFQLFGHYLKKPVVTRIEVQYNYKSISSYSITPQILKQHMTLKEGEISPLISLLKHSLLNPSGTYLAVLKTVEFEKARTAPYIQDRTPSAMNQMRYARVFLAYAKKLKEMGFDPVNFLIESL